MQPNPAPEKSAQALPKNKTISDVVRDKLTNQRKRTGAKSPWRRSTKKNSCSTQKRAALKKWKQVIKSAKSN